jgi:hypothetical protein
MGTISRRGTRDKPAYYASYVDADVDGDPHQRRQASTNRRQASTSID